MNAANSLKRNHQGKRKTLELLNELQDATVKQKTSGSFPEIYLSRSSLYRLEMNRDKIVQQLIRNRQRVRGTFKSNPKVLFS